MRDCELAPEPTTIMHDGSTKLENRFMRQWTVATRPRPGLCDHADGGGRHAEGGGTSMRAATMRRRPPVAAVPQGPFADLNHPCPCLFAIAAASTAAAAAARRPRRAPCGAGGEVDEEEPRCVP